MASIGAISCDVVNAGDLPEPSEAIVTWTNPGHNGLGIQFLGQHGEASMISAELWNTIANVRAWCVALRALKGSTVAIAVTDNYQTTTTNIHVIDVVRTTDQAIVRGGVTIAKGVAILRVVKVA